MNEHMRLSIALAPVLIAACGDPEIIVPDVLSIVAILPSHGAIDVGPNTDALVYFSHAVAAPETLGDKITIECLGTAASASATPCATPAFAGCLAALVATEVDYRPDARLALVTHAAPLQATTCYALQVESGIASTEDEVGELPATIRSSFETH
jgi:hypothetical protein